MQVFPSPQCNCFTGFVLCPHKATNTSPYVSPLDAEGFLMAMGPFKYPLFRIRDYCFGNEFKALWTHYFTNAIIVFFFPVN